MAEMLTVEAWQRADSLTGAGWEGLDPPKNLL
jgi:hypothetical protein